MAHSHILEVETEGSYYHIPYASIDHLYIQNGTVFIDTQSTRIGKKFDNAYEALRFAEMVNKGLKENPKTCKYQAPEEVPEKVKKMVNFIHTMMIFKELILCGQADSEMADILFHTSFDHTKTLGESIEDNMKLVIEIANAKGDC